MDTVRYSNAGLDFTRVRPLPFSLALDYAVGAASYASGATGGLSGTIDVAFSDMLGNHRFEVLTDLSGDILSSDLYVQYWLLPFRVDYGFVLFQTRSYPYYAPGQLLVERVDRGLSSMAVYPFDRFTRAELGLTGYVGAESTWVSTSIGWRLGGHDLGFVSYASPALVFDNTYWTAEGPARGVRARAAADLALFGTRRFCQPYADLRGYLRLGRQYVLAGRAAGIGSFGPDAGRFSLGGEYVRGYDWGEFSAEDGPGLALANLELRYPFIERLKLGFPLPLELGGIRGVAFADAGAVLRDSMRFWNGTDSGLQDLKVSVGAGLRVQVSYFALKFDFAKPLSATDDRSWKFVFGIGSDF
jgi:outer membrane protein assembly factor BamA